MLRLFFCPHKTNIPIIKIITRSLVVRSGGIWNFQHCIVITRGQEGRIPKTASVVGILPCYTSRAWCSFPWLASPLNATLQADRPIATIVYSRGNATPSNGNAGLGWGELEVGWSQVGKISRSSLVCLGLIGDESVSGSGSGTNLKASDDGSCCHRPA